MSGRLETNLRQHVSPSYLLSPSNFLMMAGVSENLSLTAYRVYTIGFRREYMIVASSSVLPTVPETLYGLLLTALLQLFPPPPPLALRMWPLILIPSWQYQTAMPSSQGQYLFYLSSHSKFRYAECKLKGDNIKDRKRIWLNLVCYRVPMLQLIKSVPIAWYIEVSPVCDSLK